MENLSSASSARRLGVPGAWPGFFGTLAVPTVVCAFLGASVASRAQAPGANTNRVESALRQAESLQQARAVSETQKAAAPAAAEDEVPETYPGENADLGPQLLLKQKAPQRKPLFEFSSDTMFTWTSNALSEATGPKDKGIVAETFSLTLAPEPVNLGGGKLALRAGYRHLLWMFDVSDRDDALNGGNFEMSTVFLGANFNFLENWNASLGVDYNRILNLKTGRDWEYGHILGSNWSESYVEWNPNWSLSRNIALADKLNLSVSYSGGYHFSRTDAKPSWERTNSSDRLDNGASVSLICSPVDKFVLIPSIRFMHSLYTHPQESGGHRQDRSLGPSLTVMLLPTPRIAVRFSLSGEFRHTTDRVVPKYSKLDAGSGVTVSLKF